ncbi:hypothetical protein JQC91_06385 [Jannaschia sp. Os4]|uniref:hypothetical protein n=1 Tax=Jannaschia sp. Os4 TaxID=2807617 RepID=UPI0019396C84|nr:hypothetical protein [Jannaschia sp. Os4]MBM2575925.1 hypothetical protein [Jannaschia sp. Os4]
MSAWWSKAACAAAVSLACAMPAPAAVLGVFSYDYGNGTTGGNDVPLDFNRLETDSVRLQDSTQSSPGLPGDVAFDRFDLSSLGGATIDSFEFTLVFDGARSSNGETWFLDIYGSIPGPFVDNRWARLEDDAGIDTLTLTLDALTDAAPIDAFAHIVSTLDFSFGFEETSTGRDRMNIYSASLSVFGTTAAVPIPAPGVLLLGALGALAWRRRRAAATA